MKATHILFIAWEKADEKVAQANDWANFANNNKSKRDCKSKGDHRLYKVVVYKKGTWSTDLMHLSTGQIYILGHGAAGYGSIANIDGDGRAELSAIEVADRLRGSGLSDTFQGKIKCYNCNSANSANDQLAFAKIFADRIREKGHTHCQIFGYNSSIAASYKPSSFGVGDQQHKHAVLEVEVFGDDDGTLITETIPISRAGEHKVSF